MNEPSAAVQSPQTKLASVEWTDLGDASAFEGESPRGVSALGHQLVILPTESGPRCLTGRCPHQGALLSEGTWDGSELVCPNHGWRFDAEGKRVGGHERLTSYPTEIRHGRLFAKLPPAQPCAHSSDAPLSGTRRAQRTLADLPHPPRLPVLGNAHQLPLDRLHVRLEEWATKYGCPYVVNIGNQLFVTVDDPETIDFVHRSRPEYFRRFSRIEEIFRELGVHGVFSAEGTEWPDQRRLAVAALAQRNLKGFFGTIAKVSERLLGRWNAAAESDTPLDVLEELMLFTVDVTSTLAFGRESNTVENSEDRIQEHLRLIFPSLERRLAAVFPYWRYLRMPKDRALDRAMISLSKWIETLIEEAQLELEQNPNLRERPTNFLQAMLVHRTSTGESFNPEVIRANMLTMLLAGEDTTAGAVAWTVHEALEHPQVIGNLRSEADEILRDAPYPTSVEMTGELRYTMAALNEALRVRPVAPMQSFTTVQDVTLGDVFVPAKTHVTTLNRLSSTLDDVGGMTFSPERFLDEKALPLLKRRGVYIPFGSGPRVCPGRSLALIEARLLLSLLFKNFEIERVGTYEDVHEHLSFTMAPRGLKVRLARRTRAA